MNVLVTGSRVYIGSLLCPSLQKMGWNVIEYDKVTGQDLFNPSQLEDAVLRADCVVHLGAIVGMKAVDDFKEVSRWTNVGVTKDLLKFGKKMVYCSVLCGYNGAQYVTEETPVSPSHEYFKQKLEAEQMVVKANRYNTVLRLGSVYGLSPNFRDDLLVHTLCRDGVKGRIELYDGGALRPLANIIDVAAAIIFMIGLPEQGGVYNVVSTNIPKAVIAELVQSETGCEVANVEGNDVERRDCFVSAEKIEALGFRFRANIRETIKNIVRCCG